MGIIMKYVAVLPYTYRPYYRACRASMAPEFRENVLFIDNTDPSKNIGCMASHNLGMKRMFDVGADWLIILSPAIRFGEPGGLDFVKVLQDHPDHYVIHAATPNVKGGLQHKEEGRNQKNGVKGWHCTAFSRELLEAVGGWDTNLSPYSLCDIDLSIRIQKHMNGAPGWDTYPCEIRDMGMGHSINLAKVKAPYEPRNGYFRSKWDRDGGEWQKEAWDHPFNDPSKPLSWWPTPPDPRSLDHEYWERIIKGNPWEAGVNNG